MALRFYRRVKILPGVGVNFSLSGPSLSLGVRGAHVTFSRRGVRKTVGIPGTGVYYTSLAGYHSGARHDGSAGELLAALALALGAFLVMRALAG
jgi:hypothetical protein